MALISCPECHRQISDLAVSCPHCGYPLKTIQNQKSLQRNTSKKHRRLPNGFGQITEIKGRYLRKPFRAMVTVGKTPEGRPISKLLGPVAYFKTYNEAYEALIEYHNDPYDFSPQITMQELFDRFIENYRAKGKKESSVKDIQSAWTHHGSVISDMKVSDVRVYHLKETINKCESPGLKKKTKTLFNMMFDYAVEYEIAKHNYAKDFTLDSSVEREFESNRDGHLAYSPNELQILWENVDFMYVDTLLIQAYSGWRPIELLTLKLDDIDIQNGIMKGGVKTEAGKKRVVPIHPDILNLIIAKYNNAKAVGSKYLCFNEDQRNGYERLDLTYSMWKSRYKKVIRSLRLKPEHKPHDGRKTFITMAKACGVDEYALKSIVGHEINDVTEKVYTERQTKWLKAEMCKITLNGYLESFE